MGTDQMNAIVEDVEVVDVTVTEMVAEIEEGTDPEVVVGDVTDQEVEIVTEDGIVTGAMTGEGETGVTPEIIGGVVTVPRDQMIKQRIGIFKRCKSRCHVAYQYFNFNFVSFSSLFSMLYIIPLPKYFKFKL